MSWLYPVTLAVRTKQGLTGDIECLCVKQLAGKEFGLYTADITDPSTEIDIGLDPVPFTDPEDVLIDQYLVESFWRLEIEQAEVVLCMNQQPISSISATDLSNPALVDLFDLKFVAYNLSQRLDRLATCLITADNALHRIDRTLSALESLPNLSADTKQYLEWLKKKFITTLIVCRITPTPS